MPSDLARVVSTLCFPHWYAGKFSFIGSIWIGIGILFLFVYKVERLSISAFHVVETPSIRIKKFDIRHNFWSEVVTG